MCKTIVHVLRNGQFHMRGVKIQIFENRLHMKLYPVLHCRQVKTVQLSRDNHVFMGGPQSKYLVFYSKQQAGSKFFNLLYQTWKI